MPLVIDADGLNWLAKEPEWWRHLPDDAILTPHPGEMARLTGLSVEEIQQDRTGIARKMAAEWRKVVVLKGAYTVVAGGDSLAVSPFANPALASAGTGDVLAGAIAGLLAQGINACDAAVAGVYLHGLAGEMVAGRLGEAGVLASDLLPELPLAIKHTKAAGGKEKRAASY
jgi:NAD(P)H-hydrate epimerase